MMKMAEEKGEKARHAKKAAGGEAGRREESKDSGKAGAKKETMGSREPRGAKEKISGEKVKHAKAGKEKEGRAKREGHAKSAKMHKKEKRAKGDAEKKLAKIREMIKKKPRPHFKGMFGNRQTRRISAAKWNRWRHPRGIDIRRLRERGLWPKTGYRTPRAIRYLHPSGMQKALVHNTKELEAAGEGKAVVIASKVGGKKRGEIIALAKQRGFMVVNR